MVLKSWAGQRAGKSPSLVSGPVFRCRQPRRDKKQTHTVGMQRAPAGIRRLVTSQVQSSTAPRYHFLLSKMGILYTLFTWEGVPGSQEPSSAKVSGKTEVPKWRSGNLVREGTRIREGKWDWRITIKENPAVVLQWKSKLELLRWTNRTKEGRWVCSAILGWWLRMLAWEYTRKQDTLIGIPKGPQNTLDDVRVYRI